MNNPCLSCGACCAYYRVSFYWGEAETGHIPVNMTVPITPHRLAMHGTEKHPPRCTALRGEIGDCVNCDIYEMRPSPCRSVMPSWHNGGADEQCDRARMAWGLPPLQPAGPGDPPLLPDGNLPRVA